jgi:hypothetical protein
VWAPMLTRTVLPLGLDNELIVPAESTNGVGKVDRRERLGGLLRFYYWKAA